MEGVEEKGMEEGEADGKRVGGEAWVMEEREEG